ncbi:hypothetical protein GCM10022267_75260 [Lentzea roselyniae]|uniref:Ornithine carbamoyltransferase n=1 Tax=Lentzea roselyniae TaxID=531940 RepID=A0ABP7C4H1_9PSEU
MEGLTDSWHPTQMLSDILTMTEHFNGQIEDIKFAFVGDGHNNVARSLLITGACSAWTSASPPPPSCSHPPT